MYLDRGYAFFAPDPGPSHLIEGRDHRALRRTDRDVIPDLQQQRPRLNYHRHFMLSEFLTEIYQPPGPPPNLEQTDPLLAAEWGRLRLRYEHVRQSIVDHLRHQNNNKVVQIRRVEHLIPDFIEFEQAKIALNDPRLYVVLSDAPVTAEGLPIEPAESIPAPTALSAPFITARGCSEK